MRAHKFEVWGIEKENLWQWRSTVEEAMMMAMMITIWKHGFEILLLGLLAICVCEGSVMIVMMMTALG